MGLKEKIRFLREGRNLSISELAERVGIDRSTLSRIESGERKIVADLVQRLANALSVDIATLYDVEPLKIVPLRPIPLVSRIPAGDPIEYTNADYPAGWAEEFVPCPEDVSDPAAFALKVEGQSMEPRFKDGDIVIISPQAKLKDGAPVVYRLKNGDCAVKNYHGGENNEIILCPENPQKGGVQVFKPSDFVWIYPVVKAITNVP